jgi:hypothetical protein
VVPSREEQGGYEERGPAQEVEDERGHAAFPVMTS